MSKLFWHFKGTYILNSLFVPNAEWTRDEFSTELYGRSPSWESLGLGAMWPPYSGDSAALCGRCPWLWVPECSPVGKAARARPSAWIVCTSVIGCQWLWWLGVSGRHAIVTPCSLPAHSFPGLAGSQVNFTEAEREKEHNPEPNWGREKGLQSWEDGVEGVAFRAGREVMSSHSSQRGAQPRVMPSWFDFIAGPGLATWVRGQSQGYRLDVLPVLG